jgi:ABC-type transport system involved in cytochrome c biogenesis ATPase subunit
MSVIVEQTHLQESALPNTRTIWDEIDIWANELQSWQRFIIATAIRDTTLSPEQVDEAYLLFLQESALSDTSTTPTPMPVEMPGRPRNITEGVVLLTGIKNLEHVNALPQTAGLVFGEGLTVIYGANGAGKSGFSRILASSCFSRFRPIIRPNIYATLVVDSPNAEIGIKDSTGNETAISLVNCTKHDDLKRFSVFDSEVARIHLSERNAFSFKPAGFDVFNEMARVYNLLSDKLASDIDRKDQPHSFSASFIAPESEISRQIALTGTETDLAALKEMAIYGETEIRRLEELSQQLDAIKRQGVTETLKQFAQMKSDLNDFSMRLHSALSHFSMEQQQKCLTILHEAQLKSAAAAQLGSDQFQQSCFNAIGTPVWESFLQAARTLSLVEHEGYPSDGDNCLLCHRPLDDSSRELIQRFWSFLSSTARQDAEQANLRLAQEIGSLKHLSLNLLPEESRIRSHLSQLDAKFLEQVEALITKLAERQTALLTVLEAGGMYLPEELQSLQEQFTALVGHIEADEARLREMNVDEAVLALEVERVHLRHREVLSQQIEAIEHHVLNLRWIRQAEKAKLALNTRPLTTKQKNLFESVIGVQYRLTLKEECEKLHCYFPLEPETRGNNAETVRNLTLTGGHKPHDILSEGEQRAVALADFLAEVNLNPVSAGIILDDPVNSQDYERKRHIATRLVEESTRRQVIIFTHDLPFLSLLCEMAEGVTATSILT